jgi:TRAP-type C4-dicarboxylate transport system substrate-binding protein
VRALVVVGVAALFVCHEAAASPTTLRFAAIAPDGTAWARQLRSFGHDVESLTGGAVTVKWYLAGIAGDELHALERARRGQLDGLAGSSFCPRLAPSLWVTRVLALFRTSEEGHYILNRLRPAVDAEMAQAGFVNLGLGSFGYELLLSRTPVRTWDELRRLRTFMWDAEPVRMKQLPALGLNVFPMPPTEAARAWDEGRIDGFLAIAQAALAYQWSSRAKYFMTLPLGFLPGCIVLSQRALDELRVEHQHAVKVAAAKFEAMFDEVTRTQEELLLGKLFQKQGLVRMTPSDALLRDFDARARDVRDSVGSRVVPQELLTRVLGWLADFRAEQEANQREAAPPPRR